MKERPILFSGPMVRAILEGRKTQTRRLVKPQPTIVDADNAEHAWWSYADGHEGVGWYVADSEYLDEGSEIRRCPYGRPGDRLWVKETWTAERRDNMPEDQRILVAYRASCDGDSFDLVEPDGSIARARVVRWKPSIFMPREFSRITLEVTGVGVERLQSITEEDARAEGVESIFERFPTMGREQLLPSGIVCADEPHRASFEFLWDELNETRAPWASNPWVWVVDFRRLEVAVGEGRAA